MPSNEKRFGFSLLSKLNRRNAYNEELMVDKLTGEVAIKTPIGDVISYNYNDRFNSHMIETRNDADKFGVYGAIHNIPFIDREMPYIFTDETSMRNSVYIKGHIKKFMLHADIDSIAIAIDELSTKRYFAKLLFGLKFHYIDNTVSELCLVNSNMLTLNHTLYDVNATTFPLLDSTKQVVGIELTQFDVNGNFDGAGDPANSIEVRHILNSLFIVIET